MNQNKRLFINSILATSAKISEKFVFFIINIIIARYLSIKTFGIYTTALSFATFFSIFTNIGINNTLVRQLNKDLKNKDYHLSNAVTIKSLLSIIIYGVITISAFFSGYSDEIFYLILIFGLVRIGNEYQSVFYAFYEASERFAMFFIYNFSFSICLLLSTIFVTLIEGNHFYFAYGRLIIVLLFSIILAFSIYIKNSFKINFQSIPNFIKNSIPFAKSSIYQNILHRTPLLLIPIFHGSYYSGFFNNAYMFFLTLFFIPNTLQKVITPFLYKIDFHTNKSLYYKFYNFYTKIIIYIAGGAFITFFLYSNEIITLIYGDKYLDSALILKIISFGLFFTFTISGTLITSLDLQEIRSKIEGVSVLFNIILSIILIYKFNMIGAAISCLISFSIIFLLSHFYLINNKYILLRDTLFPYLKLFLIIIAIYFFNNNFFYYTEIFILNLIIDLIFYTLLCSMILFTRNDYKLIFSLFSN